MYRGGRANEIRRSHRQADARRKSGANVRTGFLAHKGCETARHTVRDDGGRTARSAPAGERFRRAGAWPLRSGDVLSDGERARKYLGRIAALRRRPRYRRGGCDAGRRHGARAGREHQAQPALRAEFRVFFRGPAALRKACRGDDPRHTEHRRERMREAFCRQLAGAAPYGDRFRYGRADATRDLSPRV